jgi:chromosome segregation ATPase
MIYYLILNIYFILFLASENQLDKIVSFNQFNDNLQSYKAENEDLKIQIKQLKEDNEKLNQKNTDLEVENGRLTKKVEDLEDGMKILFSQMKELKEEIANIKKTNNEK